MKRFTETEKWKDVWFRELKGTEKLMFFYVIENCNNAGFYEEDMPMMTLQTGMSEKLIEGAWKGLARGFIRASGWVWVRTFLKHQKNDELKYENPAHRQIIRLIAEQIERFGGCPEFQEFVAPYKGLLRPIGKGNGIGTEGVKGKPDGGYVVPECFKSVDGFTAALGGWIESRKKLKKPPTGRAIQLVINRLAERPSDALKALDKATERGWTGIEWEWLDKEEAKLNGHKPAKMFLTE